MGDEIALRAISGMTRIISYPKSFNFPDLLEGSLTQSSSYPHSPPFNNESNFYVPKSIMSKKFEEFFDLEYNPSLDYIGSGSKISSHFKQQVVKNPTKIIYNNNSYKYPRSSLNPDDHEFKSIDNQFFYLENQSLFISTENTPQSQKYDISKNKNYDHQLNHLVNFKKDGSRTHNELRLANLITAIYENHDDAISTYDSKSSQILEEKGNLNGGVSLDMKDQKISKPNKIFIPERLCDDLSNEVTGTDCNLDSLNTGTHFDSLFSLEISDNHEIDYAYQWEQQQQTEHNEKIKKAIKKEYLRNLLSNYNMQDMIYYEQGQIINSSDPCSPSRLSLLTEKNRKKLRDNLKEEKMRREKLLSLNEMLAKEVATKTRGQQKNVIPFAATGISSILLTCVDCPGFNCNDFNLPSPDPITQSNLYDPIIEADVAMVMLANLNVLQRHAFDQVIKAINDTIPQLLPAIFI
ncbi:unnamed protein product [Gordionus sp. m RMFG-2023]